MKQSNHLISTTQQDDKLFERNSIVIDVSKVNNAVLKRLIAEVQFDSENHLNAYNRTHNRHNRGR